MKFKIDYYKDRFTIYLFDSKSEFKRCIEYVYNFYSPYISYMEKFEKFFELHRTDGPAMIHFDKNNNVAFIENYINNIRIK